jgi:formylglycine-generating enzyme required for sulfatase activity
MKTTLFAICVAVGSVWHAHGQTATNSTPQNGAPRSVFGVIGETRSAFAKPTIKDLMEKSQFTNATGIVMTRISDNLWAGVYLVTQEEYAKVMGNNPSQFRNDRSPVDSVSWNEAQAFCSRLVAMEDKEKMMPEGFGYTLPTQAQWEMMAGATTLAASVTSLKGNRQGTAAADSLPANSLGICDARGNLWQWCLDPADKPYRVLRGAAWNEWREVNLRPEFRWYSNGPYDKQNIYGFRVVLVRNRN